MKVFIPFFKLRSTTYFACPNAILVPLVPDDKAYARYFQERWKEKETFINVEHDIVPTQEILKSMWECPSKFCIAKCKYPFEYAVEWAPDVSYLGCVKISKELIEETPGLFDDLPVWTSCDEYIMNAVKEQYCYHGDVIHQKHNGG